MAARDDDRIAGSRPTIRDVSRIAGVSFKTVSRVINDQQYVSEDTRARVKAVMAELGFQPSQAARALAGHRSHQIALICDNPNPWFVYEVQFGVRSRCAVNGVRMIAQPYDRTSPTLLEEVVSLVDQAHPDGLVLAPPACDDQRVLEEMARRRLPLVRVQPGVRLDTSPCVYIDNEQAAVDMTAYLIGLGHRRIGFVVGDSGYAASAQRLNGYVRAMTQAGLGMDLDLVRQGDFSFDSGTAAADALLSLPVPPTAIFAANDDMAAGVLSAAHQRGLSVPGALSVVGFDDSPIARMLWPLLTTIRQPVRTLAEQAAALLLDEAAADTRLCVAHELVVRQSAGPPGGIDAAR